MREDRKAVYFGDMLRIVAMSKLSGEVSVPTISEFLTLKKRDDRHAGEIIADILAQLRSDEL